ncbi:hypothetical protein A6B43_01135 [Vespertiliibacter pulmonis]|uniref:Iron(III) transport system substrate-binding protein n=1 Tax=Vespertiliibacter pulmonis TaxID=1443036 RepID=A0A3N4WJV2_9PAST|nr:ABC transporter substrate-binding protein [Vespertiliibacter pulmonis]QLB20241.1 hypothetical protein A6B43_01135 [Vespertiliibacter pulmonis]RPE86220.1 iron(III) transport system substrate-binding protein [Vespertiliibacter pulmonis]
MQFKKLSTVAMCCLTTLFATHTVQAEGKLTVYCTVQKNVCEHITKKFSEKYNVETQFIHGGTGTIFGRIKAESANPQADFWYGGTLEPHLQAGQLGLLEPYRSPKQAETLAQFKPLIDSQKGEFTSLVYLLVLGFGVNTEKLKTLGVDMPKKWEDLLNPRLKGEVQLPDPRSSGTTYTIMATLIQLWGEEKAFAFLKQLDKNVSQYVKSNLVTANLSRGESAVTVGFVHSYATEKEKGASVEAVLPEDGVGYALGGASILKGARHLDNAKLFMDWVLSKEAQEIPWREYGVYQIPTNSTAEVSDKSVVLNKVKLIDWDYDRFGNSDEGKRLIDKWLLEIKLAK